MLKMKEMCVWERKKYTDEISSPVGKRGNKRIKFPWWCWYFSIKGECFGVSVNVIWVEKEFFFWDTYLHGLQGDTKLSSQKSISKLEQDFRTVRVMVEAGNLVESTDWKQYLSSFYFIS